jgi:enterobacteria phage integrase
MACFANAGCFAPLGKILEVSKRELGTIIVTEFGKPFTVDGFSQWIRQAIKKAKLPLDCLPHGLRKAAARHLAEAPHESGL